MHLFQKYLLSNVYRSPDEPATPDPAIVVDPIVAEPVAVEPAAGDPPVVDPGDAPKPVVPSGAPKWALERIGEETSKRQAAEEAARVATDRANSLEEITRRLQAGKSDAPPVVPAARAPDGHQDAVRQEAAQLVFAQNAQKVSDTGLAAYGPRWTDAVNTLNALGANSVEFVSSVMEIDPAKTHEIMFNIAQDPEVAASLAKMTPTARIAKITRMVMTAAVAEPKPDVKPDVKPIAISRAPAPKPALAPHAAAPDIDPRTPEGNEKMDDKAWEQWAKAGGGIDFLMKRKSA